MRTLLYALGSLGLLLTVLFSSVSPASAAHNGNNKASVMGVGVEADASGQSIVNYREGTGTFNGSINVKNLKQGVMYTFVVRLADDEGTDQVICSGTANRQGTFKCSEQDLALAGFSQAVVEDGAGNDVAIGTFARRGNWRDPQQAGSLCDAPGQNKSGSTGWFKGFSIHNRG